MSVCINYRTAKQLEPKDILKILSNTVRRLWRLRGTTHASWTGGHSVCLLTVEQAVQLEVLLEDYLP